MKNVDPKNPGHRKLNVTEAIARADARIADAARRNLARTTGGAKS